MTDEQALSLARLMRDRPDARVEIDPRGSYVSVKFTTVHHLTHTFACSITTDGSVSS